MITYEKDKHINNLIVNAPVNYISLSASRQSSKEICELHACILKNDKVINRIIHTTGTIYASFVVNKAIITTSYSYYSI